MSEAIIQAFCEYYGETVPVEQLDEASLAKKPHLNAYYQQMANWDWRFGKTPDFSHHLETRFDWGLIDMHLDVKQALITDVVIFSDALNVELIDTLRAHLLGTAYRKNSIINCLSALERAQPDIAAQVADFKKWLAGEMVS